jgi:hypothetical protein
MAAGISYAGSDELPPTEAFGVGPIGNRVGEVDPRGTYGENQSQPTNILGERAQAPIDRRASGGSTGQFPANALPARASFELPPERGPFGVLHKGQTHDKNLIVGENTMGHHIGTPPPAGEGSMDQEAEKALGLGIYGIPPMHSPDRVRRQRFDQMLAAYDQFASNIETNLLELRALDPARFDNQFAHLAKVNLPRAVPDPVLQPGFSTMEAALLRRGTQPPAQLPRGIQEVPPHFHPDHPDYVPPTEEQKLLPYQQGGYAGMSPEMAAAYRVSLAEVRRADAAAKRPVERVVPVRAASEPQPWKESQ